MNRNSTLILSYILSFSGVLETSYTSEIVHSVALICNNTQVNKRVLGPETQIGTKLKISSGFSVILLCEHQILNFYTTIHAPKKLLFQCRAVICHGIFLFHDFSLAFNILVFQDLQLAVQSFYQYFRIFLLVFHVFYQQFKIFTSISEFSIPGVQYFRIFLLVFQDLSLVVQDFYQ